MHTRLGVSGTPGILPTRSGEATGALPGICPFITKDQEGLYTSCIMYGVSLESLGLNGIRIHLQSVQYNKPVFGGLRLAAPTKIGGSRSVI